MKVGSIVVKTHCDKTNAHRGLRADWAPAKLDQSPGVRCAGIAKNLIVTAMTVPTLMTSG